MGGFCLLVVLHQEGSAPAACAAGYFFCENVHCGENIFTELAHWADSVYEVRARLKLKLKSTICMAKEYSKFKTIFI